jgi:hypothetical protein
MKVQVQNSIVAHIYNKLNTIIVLFVETPRKFITAKMRKNGPKMFKKSGELRKKVVKKCDKLLLLFIKILICNIHRL